MKIGGTSLGGLSSGGALKLHIWDATCQDKFKSSTAIYYRDADAAILMFDMNDDSTLKDIQSYWINSVKDYGPENIVLALVGNKCTENSTRLSSIGSN